MNGWFEVDEFLLSGLTYVFLVYLLVSLVLTVYFTYPKVELPGRWA